MARRNFAVVLLALIGGASTFLYTQRFTMASYLYVFFALFGLYGLAVLVIFRKRHHDSCLVLIGGFAILFRLILIFSPLTLSSDLYRYIWDGRVQHAGINPYRYPPADEALAALRDEAIFPHINRPQASTVYPPAAQMLFALMYGLWPDSVNGTKTIMVLGDLVTMLLLVRLLRQHNVEADRVLVYAWSPLVVVELAGSGHMDALMLPFLLAALLARASDKPLLAGVSLGIATLIKLYPVIVFPALYRKPDRLFPLAFGGTLLLGYLPYVVGARAQILGFLPTYFSAGEDFNVGLRYFLTAAFTPFVDSPRAVAIFLLAALFGVSALVIGWQRQRDDFWYRAYLLIAAYLLLLPTSFQPWYLVWLMPFLCFYPTWGWLYLSGSVSLSYIKYLQQPEMLPLAVRLLEFLPCYALLGGQTIWYCLKEVRAGHTSVTVTETP
jgi:alpha-1,6-mannosyltransferase